MEERKEYLANQVGLTPEEVRSASEEIVDIEISEAKFLKIVTPEDLEDRLKQIELALYYVQKVKEFILRSLTKNDFVNYGGRPYLTASGAERFRAPFGIRTENVQAFIVRGDGTQVPIDDPQAFVGDIKAVRFRGKFISTKLGSEIELQGGTLVEGAFRSKEDIVFWIKKAERNFEGRGIKILLGLDNLDWETLQTIGISEKDVERVEFVKTERIESDEAQKLWDEILKRFNGNDDEARTWLKKLTGKERTSQLTPRQAEWVKTQLSSIQAKGLTEETASWLSQAQYHFQRSGMSEEELKKILLAFGAENLEEASKLDAKSRGQILKQIVGKKS